MSETNEPPSMNDRQSLEYRHVLSDMTFLRRMFAGTEDRPNEAAIASLCIINYVCFLVHEAWITVRTLPLSSEVFDAITDLMGTPAITRARNTVKLFDNRELKFAGITSLMEEQIIEGHRRVFLGNVPENLADLESDLGLFTYRDRLVATTHGIQYNTGIPFDGDFDAMRATIRELSFKCGKFVGAIASAASSSGTSFFDAISLEEIHQSDIRSETYYRDCWGESMPIGLAASLSSFRASLNFLDCMLSTDEWQPSQVNIVKLKYITLRHTLNSLRRIQDEVGRSLDERSKHYLKSALKVPNGRDVLLPGRNKDKLRHILAHYRLKGIPIEKLHPNTPLFGLVELLHPKYSFNSFSAVVNTEITRLSGILDTWSSY